MTTNRSFNLKLALFSIIVLATISCTTTTTKADNPQSSTASIKTSKTETNATPSWRRPASHTMTRGSKDAIFSAAKESNLTLLKELLETVEVNHQNFNGETVLHIAASKGDLAMVQYLVNKGADVNALTGKQWQPIHHAMRFDHPRVANYLLSKKASLLTKTSDGLTALELGKSSKKGAMKSIIKRYSHS